MSAAKILHIPPAPHAVASAPNLRGGIVTALKLRRCDGLPLADAGLALLRLAKGGPGR